MIDWNEIKPIDFGGFKYVRGTYQTFGLKAALTMLSPLLNAIVYWKHYLLLWQARFYSPQG